VDEAHMSHAALGFADPRAPARGPVCFLHNGGGPATAGQHERRSMRSILRASLLLMMLAGTMLAGVGRAEAQVPVPLVVTGNEARGTIVLPGIQADLTISFESVVGLTPTSLLASVRLVNPIDLGLLLRLTPLTQIPVALPVVLRLAPGPQSGLSFSGVVRTQLYTQLLHLDLALPLGLHSSPNGGAFKDITVAEQSGSYRVTGSSGSFSDFVIVLDLRSLDTVITDKFNRLQAGLSAHSGAMPPAVAATLQARLTEARNGYQAGNLPQAIGKLTDFSEFTRAHSGAEIPDVWRANDPGRVNVAGLLRSRADTLAFSLGRLAGQ
jgi:hypothetical protein